ncbi:MAG: acetyl-CoA carboxylase biotin carboxyl carrier protein [Campylobacter sputorum]|uniref:acetyl-CoA carboxylase biotin carboxyl carrier protein n=1 Tax=Campylobacter sputorum TaxID=206 RepID=UPI000B784981|nr:acetyl-CoA carboxylase biotin carboxyl carrier protein [Campylobacter sputorum]ASM38820.1 acetyl-CoA carboxylase, biotin carboxyl carrier protein [Campylobacter sputorum bv. paraureolyticus LMG 11764]MDY6120527.1 acetyl-CoA carboxylase biotin carboxyl carrier protein [Campylobacter sputorum]
MKKEEIEELMKFFESINIGRVKIKRDDFEIELEKMPNENQCCPTSTTIIQSPQQPTPMQITPSNAISEKGVSKDTINSPMVGTFYIAPSPGAAPFVKIGQSVRKDDVIGIVEAMKIMNEIEAEFDCKITEILVADGQPVEFGMPLFTVEKL